MPPRRIAKFVVIGADGESREVDLGKVWEGDPGLRFRIDLDSGLGDRVRRRIEKVVKIDTGAEDVFVEADDDEPTDLLVRGVDPDTARRFKTGAGVRGLRYADYLKSLVTLHERMRARADGGEEAARDLLAELGLSTVSA